MLVFVGSITAFRYWIKDGIAVPQFAILTFIIFIISIKVIPASIEFGMIAFRDAVFYINMMSIVMFMDKRISINSFYFLFCIRASLVLEILDKLVLGPALGNVIMLAGPYSTTSLFGGSIGSTAIIFSNIAVCLLNKRKTLINEIFFILTILLIFLQMKRYIYIGVCFNIFIMMLRGIDVYRLLLSGLYIIVGVFALNIIINYALAVDIDLYFIFKYLSKDGFNLWFFIEHFLTIFGNESETFRGSAAGFEYRLKLWTYSIEMWLSTPQNFLFGVGFGIPLTNEFLGELVMREPHNSFISVIVRLGVLGVVLLFCLSYFITLQLWKFIIKKKSCVFSGVLLFNVCAIWIMALVQPAFELPPVAAMLSMSIGLLLGKGVKISSSDK